MLPVFLEGWTYALNPEAYYVYVHIDICIYMYIPCRLLLALILAGSVSGDGGNKAILWKKLRKTGANFQLVPNPTICK